MQMRLFEGKQLVAMVRGDDYAHAGEDEAIRLVFSKYKKDSKRKILDIGCGQGGTAHFIQQQGYGIVTGVDIESKSIEYAKQKYPAVEFVCSDVVDVHKNINKKFDLICAFNAFYAFPFQSEALSSLRKVANENAELIIFDYVDYDDCTHYDDDPTKVYLPIKLDSINTLLKNAGWSEAVIENLDDKYLGWYKNFVKKIENKKAEIEKRFGSDAFLIAHQRYVDLLKLLEEKKLGGAIIYALTK